MVCSFIFGCFSLYSTIISVALMGWVSKILTKADCIAIRTVSSLSAKPSNKLCKTPVNRKKLLLHKM